MADERYPFLVAEEDGRVQGFIYAGAFRTKEAYRWDVELTLYLAPGSTGRGLGRLLMDACLRLLGDFSQPPKEPLPVAAIQNQL